MSAKYRYGTANFRSYGDAKRSYCSTTDQCLEEGRIIIGEPELRDNEKLLVDTRGRYHIEVTPTE